MVLAIPLIVHVLTDNLLLQTVLTTTWHFWQNLGHPRTFRGKDRKKSCYHQGKVQTSGKRRINTFAVSACTRVIWKMLWCWWLCTSHIPQHVYLHMATFILRYLEGSNNHVQGLWGYLGDWWRKHHVRLHMTVGPLKLVLQQLPQKDLVRRNGQWNPSNMKRAG